MQKFNNPCIKTGDFAKLCGTNKRTLIHYDEIGLFKPAYTNELGYRFYSESQFDVFFTITCLKELGMPLREIGTFLEHRNPQSLKQLLLEQRENIKKEEERLKKIKEVVETKLSLVSLQETLLKRKEEIILESSSEEYLILSDPLHTSNHDAIIQTLCQHIEYCNLHNLNAGHPYGAMQDVRELRQNQMDTYAYFFTKVIKYPANHTFHIKPAGNYAVAYLQGDYYDSKYTFEKLLQWIDTNHFTAGKYAYKEAVIDELATAVSEEYLTKISIQVF